MATKHKNDAERSGELTAQPSTTPEANLPENPSDWLRLPRPKTRLWGLSRTTWNQLLDSGAVKGLRLRKKDAVRGIVLLYRPSAEAFLKSLMEGKEQR